MQVKTRLLEMPPPAATRGALVNPPYKWEPHLRLLDPTTISAQGERMGLQAPKGCYGLAPKQVRIGSPKYNPPPAQRRQSSYSPFPKRVKGLQPQWLGFRIALPYPDP